MRDDAHLDVSQVTWRDRISVAVVLAGLFTMMVLGHAGGVAIPVFATVLGIIGYLTTHPLSLRRIPGWFWVLSAFVGWAVISSIWSPYVDDQSLTNPMKLLIGFLVYPGVMLLFMTARKTDNGVLPHMFMAVLILALGVLLIDLMTGYGISFLVDPMRPGDAHIRRAAIFEMNLGHAIVILTLLAPIGMVIMYRWLPMGWLIAPIFAVFIILAAILGQLAVGVIAMIAVLLSMSFARFAPAKTLRLLIWVAIASILLAPFWSYPLGYVSSEFKASIPFSWEHRIEMWGYTSRKILESPIWGHGFDAARAFDGTFSSRGVEDWAIVSLHPHNAGLHIWAETGLIGATLASIAFLTIGISAERFCHGSRMRTMATAGVIAGVIVIGNITYGVWQEWWWATLFFTAGALYLLPRKFLDS